jgi:hypothetical protein
VARKEGRNITDPIRTSRKNKILIRKIGNPGAPFGYSENSIYKS